MRLVLAFLLFVALVGCDRSDTDSKPPQGSADEAGLIVGVTGSVKITGTNRNATVSPADVGTPVYAGDEIHLDEGDSLSVLNAEGSVTTWGGELREEIRGIASAEVQAAIQRVTRLAGRRRSDIDRRMYWPMPHLPLSRAWAAVFRKEGDEESLAIEFRSGDGPLGSVLHYSEQPERPGRYRPGLLAESSADEVAGVRVTVFFDGGSESVVTSFLPAPREATFAADLTRWGSLPEPARSIGRGAVFEEYSQLPWAIASYEDALEIAPESRKLHDKIRDLQESLAPR